MNKLILATSQYCGPCANVKEFIKVNNIDVEFKSLEEDFSFFEENSIKSVPTLISGKVKYTGAERIMRFFEDQQND